MKTKIINKILYILMIVAGVGLLAYPIATNIIGQYTNENSQQSFIETVETKPEIIEDKLKVLRAYNANLSPLMTIPEDIWRGKSVEDALIPAGEVMGILEIPKLDLREAIYYGSTDDVLNKGIGLLENTSFPTGDNSSHSVLTGHRGLPGNLLFRHLDKLSDGDIFYINLYGKKTAYKIISHKIVEPHEIQSVKVEDNKTLVTLLTCEPYMINSHRLLYTAEMIPYNETQKMEYVHEQTKNWKVLIINNWDYIIGLGIVLYIFVMIFCIVKLIKLIKS